MKKTFYGSILAVAIVQYYLLGILGIVNYVVLSITNLYVVLIAAIIVRYIQKIRIKDN